MQSTKGDAISSCGSRVYHLFRLACLSRLIIFIISVSSYYIITPYDTSARTLVPSTPLSALDQSLSQTFLPFYQWDGIYFIEIAQRGYLYERVHAFFPGYPLCIWACAKALHLVFQSWISFTTLTLYCAWLITNAAFVGSVVLFYQLTLQVFNGNQEFAYHSALCFCVGPAGIFLSAAYSESLCCFFTFLGFYYLVQHQVLCQSLSTSAQSHQYLYQCALAFGIASCIRSNGILLSLFIAFHRVLYSPGPRRTGVFIRYWAQTLVFGLIAIGPQVLYFAYGIHLYCPELASGTMSAILPSLIQENRPWCDFVVPKIWSMYTFIQSEYWHVGLFRYYTPQQIPNFILAGPIVLVSIHGFKHMSTVQSYFHPKIRLSPYYAHLLFLLVNGILVVHVQILTRMLSACPPIYWSVAFFTTTYPDRAKQYYTPLICVYFALYNVLGPVLFSNSYPWT